jgi:RNA polymerase sigma-70 factor (ECF subfamily)
VVDEPRDDAELVARALRDRHAFAPLYERYAEPIFRFCYARLGSEEAAADATSEIFTKALMALSQFRGGSFRAWIFTIAHHVVIDRYRARPPDTSLTAAAALTDPTPTPEQAAMLADQRRAFHDLLAQLTDDQRRIIELRLAGLTGAEIAEVLGCSLSAVKSSQFRAFARLRRLLDPSTHRADGDANDE